MCGLKILTNLRLIFRVGSLFEKKNVKTRIILLFIKDNVVDLGAFLFF